MRNRIPAVRSWRVRYWLERKVVVEYLVDAPNVQFARWAARDMHRTCWVFSGANEQFPLFVDRITVSPLHPPKVQP